MTEYINLRFLCYSSFSRNFATDETNYLKAAKAAKQTT